MLVILTQHVICDGLDNAEPGTVHDLRPDLAAALIETQSAVPYETKVERPPQNKAKKKPLASSRRGRPPAKKTSKRSKASAKKS